MTNTTFTDFIQQGLTWLESHNYGEALAAFRQAIRLNPRAAEAWNYQGNVLSLLNQTSQALDCYDRAVAIRPDYHQAWYHKGILLQEMGAYGNALECYNQAIALDSDPIYHHRRDGIWLKRQLFA